MFKRGTPSRPPGGPYGRSGYKRPGRAAAGQHKGTGCEGCAGRQSCFPPHPGDQPGLTYRRLHDPALDRGLVPPGLRRRLPPPRSARRPGAGPLLPQSRRGLSPACSAKREGVTRAARRESASPRPPVPAGPPGASSSSRPRRSREADMSAYTPPAAHFRFLATLPPGHEAASVSASPHFRRLARPDAHAQRALWRALGGKAGPPWWGVVLRRGLPGLVLSSHCPQRVRRPVAGGPYLSPLSPASAVCVPAGSLCSTFTEPLRWGPGYPGAFTGTVTGQQERGQQQQCHVFFSVRPPKSRFNAVLDSSGTEVHSAMNCSYYSVLL